MPCALSILLQWSLKMTLFPQTSWLPIPVWRIFFTPGFPVWSSLLEPSPLVWEVGLRLVSSNTSGRHGVWRADLFHVFGKCSLRWAPQALFFILKDNIDSSCSINVFWVNVEAFFDKVCLAILRNEKILLHAFGGFFAKKLFNDNNHLRTEYSIIKTPVRPTTV